MALHSRHPCQTNRNHIRAMRTFTLTIEEGLEIQAKHLSEWKRVLTATFYSVVEKEVDRANEILKDLVENEAIDKSTAGFEVIRGNDLAMLIQNLNK
jgi:hypothetical protein